MADITVTAGNVLRVSGDVVRGTSGATITAGHALYYDSAAGTYKLCDVDSATLAIRTFYGIALNGASSGQPVDVQVNGVINIGATLLPGGIYLASNTAGGIMPHGDLSVGEYPAIIGVALTTANLEFIKTNGAYYNVAYAP